MRRACNTCAQTQESIFMQRSHLCTNIQQNGTAISAVQDGVKCPKIKCLLLCAFGLKMKMQSAAKGFASSDCVVNRFTDAGQRRLQKLGGENCVDAMS